MSLNHALMTYRGVQHDISYVMHVCHAEKRVYRCTVGDYRGSHMEMLPTVLELPWVTVPWVTGDTKYQYRGEQKSTVGNSTVGNIVFAVTHGT